MLLSSVAGIRDDLGFDDMVDVNDAITAALNSAETILAGRLGTTFEDSTNTDMFFLQKAGFRVQNHRETQFRLRKGMVRALTSAVRAATPDLLTDSSSYLDITGSIRLSADKGVVTDYKSDYTNEYVQFVYTAGFELEADGVTYKASQVPSWLREAAKMQATILLANSASVQEAQIKIDTQTLSMNLEGVIRQNLRYVPMGVLPL